MTLREMMKNDDISRINIDELNNMIEMIEDYRREMETSMLPHHLEDMKDDLQFLCELRNEYYKITV